MTSFAQDCKTVPVMHPRLLALLRCPEHLDTGLEPAPADEPGLRCRACGRVYPIVAGIVDMLASARLPTDYREREMKQWDNYSGQYDEHRARDPNYMACVQAAARALQPSTDAVVLDAGCGTGLPLRQYLRPGLFVVALDLSLESLRYVQRVLPTGQVSFVRADLTALPFANGVFDRVLCANTLQHIPDPELRTSAVRSLARVTQRSGRVVVSVHNASLPRWLAGKPKQGPAGSAGQRIQYLYRFNRAEFRGLLADALQVQSLRGAGLGFCYNYKLSGLSRLTENVFSRFGLSTYFGRMLVGVCQPKELKQFHA
jgi:ubiquinone/menaquinone biosynthesis C-methylase UbiE